MTREEFRTKLRDLRMQEELCKDNAQLLLIREERHELERKYRKSLMEEAMKEQNKRR